MNQDQWPLVSVVIPTFLRPDRLGDAVQSVLDQEYPALEILIVDDNTPDSSEHGATEKLVTETFKDQRIRYVKTPRNLGGAGARNYGANQARGKYLAFLDDDDRWLPGKTALQIDVFQNSQEQLGLVYTGLLVENSNGEVVKERPAPASGWIQDELALNNVVGTTSSAMVPRNVFDEVGGFDAAFPARQDLDLWFRIAAKYPVHGLDQNLTINVRHGEERITLNLSRKLKARIMFRTKYRSYFRSHSTIDARYLFVTGRSCGKHGMRFRARWYFFRSLLRKPSGKSFIGFMRGRGV